MFLSKFEFNNEVVEAFVDDAGRDWFRGTQVCKVLEIGDAYSAINRYAQEYSREWKVGEGRPALYVSEPGLYALIFASKSVAAKNFQRWVFEEVLPKLRASGAYIMPNATSEQLQAALNEIVALNDKVASSNRRALQWRQELDRFKLGHRTIRQFLHDCTKSDKDDSGCLLYELYGVFQHWSSTMYMIQAVKPEHMNYPTLLREDGVSKFPSSKECFLRFFEPSCRIPPQ